MTTLQQSSNESLLVLCVEDRAQVARAVLAAACRATGVSARLEVVKGSGSLFRSLYVSRDQPQADLVWSLGPFMADIATRENLLASHEPTSWPPSGIAAPLEKAAHDAEWRWGAFDFLVPAVAGEPAIANPDEVNSGQVVRLAVADPMISERGHLLVMALHHRAEMREYDAWEWWGNRAAAGIELVPTVAAAIEAARSGRASHAIFYADGVSGAPGSRLLQNVAPMPNALAVVRGTPRLEKARLVYDWLMGPGGAEALRASGQGGLSVWHAETNGLQALASGAPAFDLEWAAGRYLSVRVRWAEERRFSSWPFGGR